MAKRSVGDRRPEPDPLRDRSKAGQGRPRFEGLRLRGGRIDVMIENPARACSCRLDEADVLDEVGPGEGLGAEEVEAHGTDSPLSAETDAIRDRLRRDKRAARASALSL